MNTVKKLWNGEFPLPTVFWGFGVLAWFVVFGIEVLIGENYVFLSMAGIVTLLTGFIILLKITYYPLVYISIWRSATKYQGSKVWSVFAKVLAVILGLLLALNLYVYVYLEKGRLLVDILNEVEAINKSAPQKSGRLVLVKAERDYMTIIQHFHIDEPINKLDVASEQAQYKKLSKIVYCTKKNRLYALDNGASFRDIFYDKEGKKLFEIFVTRERCNT